MRITRSLLALAVSASVTLGGVAAASHTAQAVAPRPTAILTPTNDVMGVASLCTYRVNQYRRAYGIAPVAMNAKVQLAAQKHSNYQASISTMTHRGKWWATYDAGKRIKLESYNWSWWGENVAAGQANCDVVVRAWMNSPGHRANILNPKFTNIGVAAKKSTKGTIFWTMDFGRPL